MNSTAIVWAFFSLIVGYGATRAIGAPRKVSALVGTIAAVASFVAVLNAKEHLALILIVFGLMFSVFVLILANGLRRRRKRQ